MINVLCFGDSNTNGVCPTGGRWGRHDRWPGILQDILGDEYYIIEEGFPGRVACVEAFLEPNRNGLDTLPDALKSHSPLDLVILMLGTNDMKHRYSLLGRDIGRGLKDMGRLIEHFDYGSDGWPIPKIMIASPIELGDGIEDSIYEGFTPDAVEMSKNLHIYLKNVADANGWYFFNAALYASPSKVDKLHIDREGHQKIAEALATQIRGIFETSEGEKKS